jgi:hypothetical protein
MPMPRPSLLACCLFVLGVPGAWGAPMLAHHAVYDLTLKSSKEGAVIGATGTMDYEMLDVCEGWTTHQRLDMQVTNSDGQTIHMLSDYATFESMDGRRMRFDTRQMTDDAVTSEVQGNASLAADGSGGVAHYILPRVDTERLPAGTLFPTAHTAKLLAAAEAGRRTLSVPLFDGTTEKGAEDSFIFVVRWSGPQAFRFPLLARLPSGQFHISFFDRHPSELTPDYEVSLRYWSNGVADDLAMDFGDFVMGGQLHSFTPMPPHGC